MINLKIPVPENEMVLILVSGDKYKLTAISQEAIEGDNPEVLAMFIRRLNEGLTS